MTKQLQCDSGVGRSMGKCSAKRPFMYLFVLMSRRRKALACIQRTRETPQSSRIKQMDRNGATNHHSHRQMTPFNINGSIIYDINVRENVTSPALNEHHSWIFPSSLLKNAINTFWTMHQPRSDAPKTHWRYETAGRLLINSGSSRINTIPHIWVLTRESYQVDCFPEKMFYSNKQVKIVLFHIHCNF